MEKELTQLYEETYKEYLKQATRSLGDPFYAEDCVQESFENALRYLKTFKGPCLRSWFSKVFRNTVINYISYIRAGGVVTELKYKDHPIYPQEISDRFKGVVEGEIDKFECSPRDKLILDHYFIKGYGAKLTAISAECTEGSVYMVANRFKNHLVLKYE